MTLIGLGEEPNLVDAFTKPESLTEVRVEAVDLQKGSFLLARAIWALRKNVTLAWADNKAVSRSRRDRGTKIVVTGPPPFLPYMMIVLKLLLVRRTLIYHLTDFYPNTVFAAGFMQRFQFVSGLFHLLRRFATRIEALGEDHKRGLLRMGVKREAIVSVRDDSPLDVSGPSLIAERAFPADKALLLYSGTPVIAHGIDTLVRAYDCHVNQRSNRVRLWVDGANAWLGPLQEAYAARLLFASFIGFHQC